MTVEATWDISIGTTTYLVTAESGSHGKVSIRVNGVAAAKPLGPDEIERVISVGPHLYRLSKSPDSGYELDPVVRATADRNVVAGLVPTAKSAPWLSQRIIGWGALVVAVAILLGFALPPGYEKHARQRTESILADMSKGDYVYQNVAMALWARDTRMLADRDELSWASDHYEAWRAEKGLKRAFTRWRVVDSKEVEGAAVPTVIVTVEIEDRTLAMLVPERRPMSWTDVPK